MKKLLIILSFLLFTCVSYSQSNTNQELKELDPIFIEEQPPSFPGGEGKMRSFIKLVKQYPDSLESTGIEGKVYVQFVVKKTGKLSDIQILRSPDTLFSQEALRIMKLMPNWNTGTNYYGDTADTRMVIPIIFDVNSEPVFQIVEAQPSFPGGDEKLFEFLGKSIQYTELIRENGIRSKFYFEFIIEKDGSISNFKLPKNESQEFLQKCSFGI